MVTIYRGAERASPSPHKLGAAHRMGYHQAVEKEHGFELSFRWRLVRRLLFDPQLGVTRQTLYRHIRPDGSLRRDGLKGNYYRVMCQE
jgi:hypothetical protein